jgi:hypothetical protein
MSWSGTVRCGWCGKEGHNRASCDSLVEEMRWGLQSESNSLRQRAEAFFAMKHEKANRSQTRKCSYCKQTGHNRRKCDALERHLLVYSSMVRKARQKLAASMTKFGLGPGALVSFKTRSWSNVNGNWTNLNGIGLVTDHDIDKTTHRSLHKDDQRGDKKARIYVVGTLENGEKYEKWMHFPAEVASCGFVGYDARILGASTVVSPAPDVKVPESFFSWDVCNSTARTIARDEAWSANSLPWDLCEELKTRDAAR